MPGKSRRDKKFRAANQASVRPIDSVIPPAVSVNASAPAAVRPSKPAPVSASAYINRELLTISLLAGVMLAVVIIVSFILR